MIRKRLRAIDPGDALDGAPEPLVSAPTTADGRRLDAPGSGKRRSRKRNASNQKELPGL
jgi:hypothetical protein